MNYYVSLSLSVFSTSVDFESGSNKFVLQHMFVLAALFMQQISCVLSELCFWFVLDRMFIDVPAIVTEKAFSAKNNTVFSLTFIFLPQKHVIM